MYCTMVWTSALLVCLLPSLWAREILWNGEMESLRGWRCDHFKCLITNTHQSGNHAIQTRNRKSWMGVAQYIYVKAGIHYSVSLYVRLLKDDPAKLGQTIVVNMEFYLKQQNEIRQRIAAKHMHLRIIDGWVRLQGDFTVPTDDEPIVKTKLFVKGVKGVFDYILDNASVQPLLKWTNWEKDTNANINSLRKSAIHVEVLTSCGTNLNEVKVKITQTKKSFPFGTAVHCDEYYHGDTRYQNFINQHFNWAVPENCLTWIAMEKVQGHVNYERAFNAINKLRNNGIKVRGRNIVWTVYKYVPAWVKPLWRNDLKIVVHKRITDIVNKTKNLVEHWEVNNENLHQFFFQEHVKDRDYNLDIFKTAHQTAPNVKMFLNEYDIVPQGPFVGAYTSQALQFKYAKVGLYGVGVQCHFGDEKSPDPTLMKYRLDVLAQAGVPIWVTELDVNSTDENRRAEYYETALRVLYAHPAVEGILLSGFWGERHRRGDRGALVSGKNFTLNAAGKRFLDLLENQWMTSEIHKLSDSGDHFTVNGFHGDYEVTVSYNDKELVDQKKTFTLGTASHVVTFVV